MNVRIGIIYDKNAPELFNNISSILSKKFDVMGVLPDRISYLSKNEIDMVFNLYTGSNTKLEQVLIPAILKTKGIPHVGSDFFTHHISTNKILTKIIMKHYGIPTPLFFTSRDISFLESPFKFPLIVKPSREGSGLGITRDSVVYDIESLKKQVNRIYNEFNQEVLIEEFIEGREFTVGIIGNDEELTILPIMEIDFSNLPEDCEKYYSYYVKREMGSKTIYRCPADIDKNLENQIRGIAKKLYEILDCKDYARIDIRVRGNEVYYVIEINTYPGLHEDYSDLPKMARAFGLTYENLIFKIVESSLKRHGIL